MYLQVDWDERGWEWEILGWGWGGMEGESLGRERAGIGGHFEAVWKPSAMDTS